MKIFLQHTKRKFLFVFFPGLFFSQEIFSQQVFYRSLHWHEPQQVMVDSILRKVPSFEGAVYPDSLFALPVFQEVFPGMAGMRITILPGAVFEPVPDAERQFMGVLPDTFNYAVLLSTERKKPMTVLRIFPFRKNPDTGIPERLVSFRIYSFPSEQPAERTRKSAGIWSSASLLASGKWYRIKVAENGLYKLTYAQLQELGFTDPSKVRLFGYGSGMLPEVPGKRTLDDMAEVPVFFNKGSDGIFGTGDYLLFYAEGPAKRYYNESQSMFRHIVHGFSNYAWYFLSDVSGQRKEMEEYDPGQVSAVRSISTFPEHVWHENEVVNLIRSGSQWLGEAFDVNSSRSFSFSVPDMNPSAPVKVAVAAAGRYSSNTSLSVQVNNVSAGNISFSPVSLSSSTGNYASYGQAIYTVSVTGSPVTVTLQYNRPDPSAIAWLDYIDITAERILRLAGNYLPFRSVPQTSAGELAEYVLQNATEDIQVWEVSDIHRIRKMKVTVAGSVLRFKFPADSVREFIAFRPSGDFSSPVIQGEDVGLVANQNIHGAGPADMIIITHPSFVTQAEELARMRGENDGLRVHVFTTQQVYNEFSSGTPDVSAIRDAVKMFYDRALSEEDLPRYLLLFGDGSFDNRNQKPENPNYILTYQSSNSLTQTASYVSDDFFGILDDGELLTTGMLDVGVGRLPVKSAEEADIVLEKLKNYRNMAMHGDWNNLITMIGDDEDNGTHMYQSDLLATYLEQNYPEYTIEKIYLDAYRQVSSSTGTTYPDVNKAITLRMKKGALIINYVGHGNENGLAHERIVQTDDIRTWENTGKYPLFVTATCEFSRFDDVKISGSRYSDATSAGEHVLLCRGGGGIALLSTSRLVYSGPNFVLNENFYKQIFRRNADDTPLRLGDVIRFTKNSSGTGTNKLNFVLLGDPSLVLAYPQWKIVVDSLNGIPVQEFTDTVKALGSMHVSGHIEDAAGNFVPDFRGTLVAALFDKTVVITTLNNDGEGSFQYSTYNSILFKGQAGVMEGKFRFSLFVPKDINYLPGKGKISLYAKSEAMQANGVFQDIIVGGISPQAKPDDEGPSIRLFMNDTLFRDGGVTSDNPLLIALLQDEHGINTTGSGIGHDITLILDNEERFVLNDFYVAGLNDYRQGRVEFPLSGLAPGMHTLQFKAWDTYNNSAESILSFEVFHSDAPMISRLYNYPNPFSDYTSVVLEHNQAGKNGVLQLQIYSLTGELVYSWKEPLSASGFVTIPLVWTGVSPSGRKLPGGVYLYSVTLTNEQGRVVNKTGRMVVIR